MSENVTGPILSKLSAQNAKRVYASATLDPLRRQIEWTRRLVAGEEDHESQLLVKLTPLLGSALNWTLRFHNERFASERESEFETWYVEAEQMNVSDLANDIKLLNEQLENLFHPDATEESKKEMREAFDANREASILENDIPYLESLLKAEEELGDNHSKTRLDYEITDVACGIALACPNLASTNEILQKGLESSVIEAQKTAPKWRTDGVQRLGPFGIYPNNAEIMDLELRCNFDEASGVGKFKVHSPAALEVVQPFFHPDHSIEGSKANAKKIPEIGRGKKPGFFARLFGAKARDVLKSDLLDEAAPPPQKLITPDNYHLGGPLNPKSEVNIGEDDPTRKLIHIPTKATHFAWAYPVIDGDFSYVGKRLPNKASLFLIYGGYVYFDKEDGLVCQENGIGPGTTLMFSRPRPLPSEAKAFLQEKDRFKEVTIMSLKRKGAKKFTFLNPGELKHIEGMDCPFGGFAYLYDDGEIDNYFAITTVLDDSGDLALGPVWNPLDG